jgi:phosphoribosyl 1,2-cyclic phosphodiesterase
MSTLADPSARPARHDEVALALTTHGTRGSHPVEGAAFLRHGGRTTCLAVEAGAMRAIVDAGTGLIALGRMAEARPGDRFDILLSHLHHDHIQGLPFFAPAFVRGVEIHIHGGLIDGTSPEAALRQVFAPPFFPVSFDAFAARFVFSGVRAGSCFRLAGVDIETCALPHPGGAIAYKFQQAGRSLAIITDLEVTAQDVPEHVVAFARGCDLAVVDTMIPEPDYPRFRGFGHGTAEGALVLGERAGIGRVIGSHHAPWLGDAALEAISARMDKAQPGSGLARDSQRFDIF